MALVSSSSSLDFPLFWSPDPKSTSTDAYVGFRGTFNLTAAATVKFTLLGASWFTVWLDGDWFCEGPARFPHAFPESQTICADLPAGRHTLAVLANHIGISTRILEPIDPFFGCTAQIGATALNLDWKCQHFTGFAPAVRRVNPQVGFIEWCDTRQNPVGWQPPHFDDHSWDKPVSVTRPLGPLQPLAIANPRSIEHALTPFASGKFTETFGYERDDIPARFFLRDLAPAELPPQGVWRRYDLGRVRLMRPRFILDVPAGTVIEFAYCEALVSDRVSPWINLSAGDSCNLDHYVARGGPQEFSPITPRGGRFMEVHIFAPESQIKFQSEAVVERAYYGEAGGSLQTNDALLDQIWLVGVETHRACAEDAITDNPTRERGQWAGDVVTVGMDIAATAFADLRLCRRSLVHCAQCAREDGLVAGLCPGGAAFLTTYAAQWINACVHYWELTGESDLLIAMLPHAERNLAAFAAQTTADGIKDELGWGFVDWGYVRNPGPSDMGVNLHYYAALQGMIRWCDELSLADRSAHFAQIAATMQALIARYYAGEFTACEDAWTRIGYHRAALGLRLGFFDATQAKQGREFLQAHMLRCFPNRTDAPRLSDPAANNPQLITPYFGHYALPELIEHGGMDFVLDQYRTCWGWSLSGSRTTWLEVFDPRWSHCHQWAGCPTWQLSRYLLGLQPRFDLGTMHFDLSLATGSLPAAQGTCPIAGRDEVITISWTKRAGRLHYTLQSPVPLTLHLADKLGGGTVKVEHDYTAVWRVEDCV
jgi:alpha-L-rhamnosidase